MVTFWYVWQPLVAGQVSIKEIGIYCDFKLDESYTPSKISIRAGTHFHDLQVLFN
jgi:hypothetical protein